MNILEAYDFILCSVCCGNSSTNLINIFDNYIGYKSKFYSIAEIINEVMCLEVKRIFSL